MCPFHEKLQQEHDIHLSFIQVKKVLQGAGWHVGRPLPGMLCCTSMGAGTSGFRTTAGWTCRKRREIPTFLPPSSRQGQALENYFVSTQTLSAESSSTPATSVLIFTYWIPDFVPGIA